MAPRLDPDDLFRSPVPQWSDAEVAAMLEEQYGLTGQLSGLPGERDRNLLLETVDGRFNVKIANPAEDPEALVMQQEALDHLARHGGGGLRYPEAVLSRGGLPVVLVDRAGTRFAVRVQTFLAGPPLRDRPEAAGDAEVGAMVAAVQADLAGFFHRAAGRRLLWDVRRLDQPDVLAAVDDPDTARLVGAVVWRVGADVLPRLDALPAQVVHNDLNPDNLLLGERLGVVDFGDMAHGSRIADLAVAASYRLPGASDPGGVLADVVAGYTGRQSLTTAEADVLADLVAGRLCQSIAISLWRAGQHPGNADYILGDVEPARRALRALEAVDRGALRRRIRAAAGHADPAPTGAPAALVAERKAHLGPGLRLAYREPLHLVSGDGVWLTASDGRRYLDAYNNVVPIGHAHPLVAGVLERHTRRLNTNTRYLTDEVVGYARALTGLLPAGLDVCYFTNSGSEAADLAVRIARAATGNEGVVVTDHAYHGSTTVTMAMSPEELGGAPLADWVATIPPPGGPAPPASVEEAVARLAASGHRPAALVVDPIFASDGIHDPPAAYLDPAAAAIRQAGGLYVADEVQAGLGRVGARMWGCASGAATPDLVVLGKPLGNGHPIGAVVTTREVADRFTERAYFFSTFGGNTVSAAVGTAVLRHLVAERLPERADWVGEHLRAGLGALAATVEALGEVRGAGLFVGVDVIDRDGRPDEAGAAALVEAMKDRGVLIGRTGRLGNVLKIRPPLVFAERHADLLSQALGDALG